MRLFESPIAAQKPDEEVKRLQQQMFDAGIPLKVDGVYGPKTDAAAVQYAQMQKPIAPIPGQISTRTFSNEGNLKQQYVAPAPAQPVNQAPAIDPNSYLGGLLANATPKPKYNQKTEDQLRNMAKAQKIGEFLGLLGDVYGTAKGAPIQRRESTSAAPYMQSILANRDKYQDQLSAFDKQEYLRKLQIGQAYDANKDKEYNQDYAQQKFAADQAYKQFLFANKLADSAFNRKKFDETIRHNKELENAALIRANKTGAAKTAKEGKPYMQVGKQNLTEGEARAYYDEALAYYNGGKALDGTTKNQYLKGVLAAYANQPEEAKKEIVAHYLRDEKRQLDQHRAGQGQQQQPTAEPQQSGSTFTPEQEAQINLLQKKNPNATRQQIIDYIQNLK